MLKFLTALLLITFLTTSVQGSSQNHSWSIPSAKSSTYRDLLVYEFGLRGSPDKRCVFVDGYENGGLACFDK